MGTNRGPWRLLVPVARYELLARLEKLLGKGTGSLVMHIHPLEVLLRHSRAWVASEWFDQNSGAGLSRGPRPGYPFPMPGSPGPTVQAPMFVPDPHRQLNDMRTVPFIVRNFHRRYGRWPKNLAEVKAFADAKANFQPEIPVSSRATWRTPRSLPRPTAD